MVFIYWGWDTAVAVNPKDPRYAHLIGAQIETPLVLRPRPQDSRNDEFGQRDAPNGPTRLVEAEQEILDGRKNRPLRVRSAVAAPPETPTSCAKSRA